MTNLYQDNNANKPPLSRENLNAHGIEFNAHIYPIIPGEGDDRADLAHVDSVRRALLTFKLSIPSYLRRGIELEKDEFLKRATRPREVDADQINETSENGRPSDSGPPPLAQPARAQDIGTNFTLLPPEGVYDTGPSRYQLRSQEADIMQYTNAADEAKFRTKDRQAEPDWNYYLRKTVFKDFDVTSTSYQNLFDKWSLTSDTSWWDHRIEAHDGLLELSAPKPDFTYAFPIFRNDADLPDGLADLECAKNYSVHYLMGLRRANSAGGGLRFSLNTALYNLSRGQVKVGDMSNYDLMCFPWAVVEIKKPQVGNAAVQLCYCQAANGCAIALRILRSLFTTAHGVVPHDLPPIIAFTCVGADLRLWLGYMDSKLEKGQRVMMRCIFATNLELRWGLAAALNIVDNMQLWSSRVLKPRITAALSEIRRRQESRTPQIDPLSTPVPTNSDDQTGGPNEDPDFVPKSLARQLSSMTISVVAKKFANFDFQSSGKGAIKKGMSKLRRKNASKKQASASKPVPLETHSTKQKDESSLNKLAASGADASPTDVSALPDRSASSHSTNVPNFAKSPAKYSEDAINQAIARFVEKIAKPTTIGLNGNEKSNNASPVIPSLAQEFQETSGFANKEATTPERDGDSSDSEDFEYSYLNDDDLSRLRGFTIPFRSRNYRYCQYGNAREPGTSAESAGLFLDQDFSEFDEEDPDWDSDWTDNTSEPSEDEYGDFSDSMDSLSASSPNLDTEINGVEDDRTARFETKDVKLLAQHALCNILPGYITKLPAFKAIVACMKHSSLVPILCCALLKRVDRMESGASKASATEPVQIWEQFWQSEPFYGERRSRDPRAVIVEQLNLGLRLDPDTSMPSITELMPGLECGMLVLSALDLLGEHKQDIVLRKIFKNVMRCLGRGDEDALLGSSTVREHIGNQIHILGKDALAMVHLQSLTDPRLPEVEDEHGWDHGWGMGQLRELYV